MKLLIYRLNSSPLLTALYCCISYDWCSIWILPYCLTFSSSVIPNNSNMVTKSTLNFHILSWSSWCTYIITNNYGNFAIGQRSAVLAARHTMKQIIWLSCIGHNIILIFTGYLPCHICFVQHMLFFLFISLGLTAQSTWTGSSSCLAVTMGNYCASMTATEAT